jgi:hypothetical protein
MACGRCAKRVCAFGKVRWARQRDDARVTLDPRRQG